MEVLHITRHDGEIVFKGRCGDHAVRNIQWPTDELPFSIEYPPSLRDHPCYWQDTILKPGRHVAGSEDGRWAASDDFQYEVWLYDRHSGEVNLLAGPQKTGADHIHPTFNREGTKIEIQSALISKDNRSLNICVPVPKTFLNRTYNLKAPE